jgi:hypothetical protein
VPANCFDTRNPSTARWRSLNENLKIVNEKREDEGCGMGRSSPSEHNPSSIIQCSPKPAPNFLDQRFNFGGCESLNQYSRPCSLQGIRSSARIVPGREAITLEPGKRDLLDKALGVTVPKPSFSQVYPAAYFGLMTTAWHVSQPQSMEFDVFGLR